MLRKTSAEPPEPDSDLGSACIMLHDLEAQTSPPPPPPPCGAFAPAAVCARPRSDPFPWFAFLDRRPIRGRREEEPIAAWKDGPAGDAEPIPQYVVTTALSQWPQRLSRLCRHRPTQDIIDALPMLTALADKAAAAAGAAVDAQAATAEEAPPSFMAPAPRTRDVAWPPLFEPRRRLLSSHDVAHNGHI